MVSLKNLCCCEIKTGAIVACFCKLCSSTYFLVQAIIKLVNALDNTDDDLGKTKCKKFHFRFYNYSFHLPTVTLSIKFFALVFYSSIFVSVIMYIVGLKKVKTTI